MSSEFLNHNHKLFWKPYSGHLKCGSFKKRKSSWPDFPLSIFVCLPLLFSLFPPSSPPGFIPDNLVSILGLLLSKEWDMTFPDSFLVHLSHLSLPRALSLFLATGRHCRSALRNSPGHIGLSKEVNVIRCCLTSLMVIITIQAALETVPRNAPHALNYCTELF